MGKPDQPYLLNCNQIRTFIPHRSPFLLIDQILEIDLKGSAKELSTIEVGTRVRAKKNVTFNEPFMPGHFPDYSIMPGVLIVEAMAQTSCFTVYPYFSQDMEKVKGFSCVLAGVSHARFRRPVVPGDTLILETTLKKTRGRLLAFDCVATVEGQKVADAELLANIMTHDEMKGL